MNDFDAGITFIVRNKAALLQMCVGPSESYVVEQTVAALEKQARPAVSLEAGRSVDWVLVPRVATEAMRKAFYAGHSSPGVPTFTARYAAMLAATPQQPAPSECRKPCHMEPGTCTCQKYPAPVLEAS